VGIIGRREAEAVEGELSDRQFVIALRSIGRQRKTGILTVQGRDEIIAFSFSEGGIVGADALNQSLEEGLGEVLASQHLVDPAEFAALAAEHESGGGRVVDLLVERSFLSRGQLLDSLRKHTYRLCLEALSWSTGEYRFYQGDEVAFEVGVEPIGVGELLVRASLELAGAGPLALPIPGLDDVYGRTSAVVPEPDEDGAEASSATVSHRLLELLDGRRSLREVSASSDFSVFDIRDLASEWLEAGFIERMGGPSPESGIAMATAEPPVETSLSDVELGSSPALVAPAEVSGVSWEPEPEPPVGSPVQPLASDARSEVRSAELAEGAAGWLNRIFGLGVLVATLALLATEPTRILSPFPWQGTVIESFRAQQRTVKRLNIERGAQTFFLLFGHYPESPDELETSRLVKPADLDVHGGGRWRMTTSPASLVLRTPGILGADETGWTSSIVGNFLLDPEFVRPNQPAGGPLLVLLD
jgi:hypothetical protein